MKILSKNKYNNWKTVPWNKIHIIIYNLQNKIYYHAKENNTGLVRYYQKQLVKLEEKQITCCSDGESR